MACATISMNSSPVTAKIPLAEPGDYDHGGSQAGEHGSVAGDEVVARVDRRSAKQREEEVAGENRQDGGEAERAEAAQRGGHVT